MSAFHPRAFDEFTFDVDYASSTALWVSVAGENRAAGRGLESYRVLPDSTKISDIVDDTPNRAGFTAMGFIPSPGARVVMALGGIGNPDRLFAGNILNVEQGYVTDNPANEQWQVACIDDTQRLNSRKVIGHFTGTADEIVLELIAAYAPWVTTVNVATGLDTIDGGATFTNQNLTDCLTQIAKRIGAYWYLDYLGDLHFFLSEFSGSPSDHPTPLDENHPTMRGIRVSRDMSQVVTRVFVEGGGGVSLSEVSPGETILPVSESLWYNPAGGVVVCGPQRIEYDSVDEGGAGSLVGTGALPAAAPMLELADGAGVDDGEHSVTVVFVTGAGRSLPGPPATITAGAISAPSSAPTPGAVSAGGSVNVGNHDYVMTLITSAGETTPSPISASVSVPAVPSVAPTLAAGSFYPPGQVNGGAALALKYCYVYDNGQESTLSPASSVVTPATNQGWDATVPTTQPAGVASRRLYMSIDGGSTYTRKAELPFSAGGSFSHTNLVTDTGYRRYTLEANGTPSGVARNTIPLTVPTSPLSNVTNRGLYRRFNGTGTFKLVTTLDNATGAYNDTAANASLGADAPSSNTATANQIAASDIAIGPSGTTERELYMSPAGGGTRRKALTIANNTGTTGTITIDDATLAGEDAEPVADSSGLSQPEGQVLAGATSLPVAGLAGFPSQGWAVIGNGQQVIRYTGKSSTALTGIPASGVGAITATVAFNSNVTAAPQLTGIGAGSPSNGSITYTIPKGQDVNLLVQVDSLPAQEVIGALLVDDDFNATDGIIEAYVQDRRLSEDEARARGQAYLDLYSTVETTLYYQVRNDFLTKAGRTIDVDITTPIEISGSFKIQQVDISFAIKPDGEADVYFDVTASTTRFSFEDMLRQVRSRS